MGMKVILSRKGFDSANGGMPSPIMPDGTLLSMPIPSGDGVGYDALQYQGASYAHILRQLAPRKTFGGCHVDPDLGGQSRVTPIPGWAPAFGQIGSAQGLLRRAGVAPGDIFLFFGWFRRVEQHDGGYRFVPRNQGDFYDHADLQVIYGYLQIGDILRCRERIAAYPWHPHAADSRIRVPSNTLYTPAETLSLLPDRCGYGTLPYRQDRVLTMPGRSRAVWRGYPFLQPEHLYGRRKNAAVGDGIYYAGIWQELVVYESDGLLDWVKDILA